MEAAGAQCVDQEFSRAVARRFLTVFEQALQGAIDAFPPIHATFQTERSG